MFARTPTTALSRGVRALSTDSTTTTPTKLRIGYVPEHFSTPLHFARKHFALDAELVPEPLGSGALSSRLKTQTPDRQLDIAVGLTEGFVSDLGKTKAAGYENVYGLVGTYVESPLCWAISTGANRRLIKQVEDLRGKRVGVSRMGSGSYVMSQVLADQRGWLRDGGEEAAFTPEVVGKFDALRKAVRGESELKADFFMWEHFTTKRYWDNGELKRVGEIYTPWPSWVIAARASVRDQVEEVLEKITRGVEYYRSHEEEALEHITGTMDYSLEDAKEWMKTVRFADNVKGVDPQVVDTTAGLLRKAGVFGEDAGGSEHMIAIRR